MLNLLVYRIKSFWREEDAPTMVEYALLVALIALVVAVAALVLGEGISTVFSNIGDEVGTATVPNIP